MGVLPSSTLNHQINVHEYSLFYIIIRRLSLFRKGSRFVRPLWYLYVFICMGVLPSSTLNQQINVHEQCHTDHTSGMRSNMHIFCVISGFRLEVADICALLGYYTAYNSTSLTTFRENLSVPSWGVKQPKQRTKKRIYWPVRMEPRGCPETSVRMYHYMLRNIQKQCRFHVHVLPNAIDNNNMSVTKATSCGGSSNGST